MLNTNNFNLYFDINNQLDYLMQSVILRSFVCFDLRLTIDSNLSFVPHINKVLNIYYRMLAFTIRNTGDFSNIASDMPLYYFFVHYKLKYAATTFNKLLNQLSGDS